MPRRSESDGDLRLLPNEWAAQKGVLLHIAKGAFCDKLAEKISEEEFDSGVEAFMNKPATY